MRYIIALMLLLQCFALQAQTYKDSIEKFRKQYKDDFLTDARSPLKAADTSFLRFYAPDKHYRVTASFKRTAEAGILEIPTHSGKIKKYRQYGIATFSIGHKPLVLHVYKSEDLALKDSAYKNYLFIPFKDATNYTATYGGGRYLDLLVTDIKNNQLVLDFNKCYNPYCAFAGGYNCPIPPEENHMHIPIKAGEKLFGKKIAE